jgi:hypothetical protein
MVTFWIGEPTSANHPPRTPVGRLHLYHQAEHWDLLAGVAKALTRLAPNEEQGWISWAWATRRHKGIPEAQKVLLKAEPILGSTCATLHYNLAGITRQIVVKSGTGVSVDTFGL